MHLRCYDLQMRNEGGGECMLRSIASAPLDKS